ncbi:MAG: hypothetical protein R6U63_06135 [Longimicrobiales bacterium]
MLRRTQEVFARHPWVILAGLVGVHLVVSGLAFDPVPHTGGDNTAYLALARSLLGHGGYLELWEPGQPPHTQYPPGFAAILAVVWAVGLRSWTALKLIMLGFSAVAVGLSYLWMRERTTAIGAAALAFLLAVSPGLAGENRWVLSDIPFWAVTMGSLLALARGRHRWGIALAFAALGLRTAGLPLLLAIIGWHALRRRWKHAGVTLGVLVAVIAVWSLRASTLEAPYVAQFWLDNPYAPEAGRIGILDLLARIVENVDRYAFTITFRTLAGGVGTVGAIGGGLLLAAAAVGFARRVLGCEHPVADPGPEPEARGDAGRPSAASRLSARIGVVELFAVLYIGLLLVWPEQWASDRFLIPVLPVLLVYAAKGTEVIPGRAARRVVRVGALLAVLGLAVTPSLALWTGAAECRSAVQREGTVFACLPPSERAFLELAEWSRDRLAEGAVVVSRKPRLWYWHSGYPGQVYPFSRDRSRVLEVAAEIEARYVVLDELGGTSRAYLLPAVMENRHRFCAVQRQETKSGPAATLLGILAAPWDPERLGIDDDPETSGLRLPLCPSVYRPGAGSAGGD